MQNSLAITYNGVMEKKVKKYIEGQRAVLDRFEGGLAVLTGEDGTDFTADRGELPDGAASGDSLVWHDGCWYADEADTDVRRQRIAEKRRRLFREDYSDGN